MPADPFYVALYVNDMVNNRCTPSQLDAAVSAIRWGHINEGATPPTDHILVKTVVEGGKRANSHLKTHRQKEPITPQFIKSLFDTYSTHNNLIYD